MFTEQIKALEEKQETLNSNISHHQECIKTFKKELTKVKRVIKAMNEAQGDSNKQNLNEQYSISE